VSTVDEFMNADYTIPTHGGSMAPGFAGDKESADAIVSRLTATEPKHPTHSHGGVPVKTMAEVLEGHFIDITVTNPDRIGTCVCGWVAGSMSISWDEHLADALTAAGFGPVKAAAAAALKDAGEAIEARRPEMGHDINITQYREGRNDAFALASDICNARAELIEATQ
jgi:hypothetical protein